MTLTFLHTSDWQLGMTRHYLARRRGAEDDPQARFSSDRIDAVRRMGELARDRHCAFVLVAGDVFETQNVSRQVISRACSAMASIGLPVLLLPGNHDSLEPGCIWDRADFVQACPDNVTVLRARPPERRHPPRSTSDDSPWRAASAPPAGRWRAPCPRRSRRDRRCRDPDR